jgi:hypothetical protein
MYKDPDGEASGRALTPYLTGIRNNRVNASVRSIPFGWVPPDIEISATLYKNSVPVATKTGINNVSVSFSTGGVTAYWHVGYTTDRPDIFGKTELSSYSVLYNKKAVRYPSYTDLLSGKSVAAPSLTLTKVSNPVSWTTADRNNYKSWYEQTYNKGKILDWSDVQVHHIIPRAYGGTNNYSNLIPLPISVHTLFTTWWVNY